MKTKPIPLSNRCLKSIHLHHPDLSGTWLDSGDVLRLLHCSERTLQKLRSAGAFPFYKVHPHHYLYKLEEVQAYIEKCKTIKDERPSHD